MQQTQAHHNSIGVAGPAQVNYLATMPKEIQGMIQAEACKLRAHRVIIKSEKLANGKMRFFSETIPSRTIPSIDANSRAMISRILGVEYATLYPVQSDVPNQQVIVFNPERDTLHFCTAHFLDHNKVREFLSLLTREEKNKIRKITFYFDEKAWYWNSEEGCYQEIPCVEVLGEMHCLEKVTFLEDFETRAEFHYAGKDRSAMCDYWSDMFDVDDIDGDWSCPEFVFKLEDREDGTDNESEEEKGEDEKAPLGFLHVMANGVQRIVSFPSIPKLREDVVALVDVSHLQISFFETRVLICT